MTEIGKTILNNLQLKAGDLNEDGKLLKVFTAYESIMDKLLAHADNLSKNYSCGGCGKKTSKEEHIEVEPDLEYKLGTVYTNEVNETRPYDASVTANTDNTAYVEDFLEK